MAQPLVALNDRRTALTVVDYPVPFVMSVGLPGNQFGTLTSPYTAQALSPPIDADYWWLIDRVTVELTTGPDQGGTIYTLVAASDAVTMGLYIDRATTDRFLDFAPCASFAIAEYDEPLRIPPTRQILALFTAQPNVSGLAVLRFEYRLAAR